MLVGETIEAAPWRGGLASEWIAFSIPRRKRVLYPSSKNFCQCLSFMIAIGEFSAYSTAVAILFPNELNFQSRLTSEPITKKEVCSRTVSEQRPPRSSISLLTAPRAEQEPTGQYEFIRVEDDIGFRLRQRKVGRPPKVSAVVSVTDDVVY